jgi:hypothetical protein
VVPALLAACGGTGGGGGGVRAANAKLPRGAKVAPASARAFVALNTDFGSDEWRRDLALLRRFPAGREPFRAFARATGGVDFVRDVEPALGPELDIVYLDYRNGGRNLVGLTRAKNDAKLKALLAKGGGPPTVSRKLGDWTVFGDSTSLLDRFQREAKRGRLADDAAFADAVGRLDPHAAVRAYVSGKPVQAALDRALTASGAPPRLSEEVGMLRSIAADARASRDGVRLDGLIRVDSDVHPNAYTAKLPEDVPAGPLQYMSFNHVDLVLKKTLKLVSETNKSFEQQLSQVEAVTDVTLSHDIYPLLSHEGAVAVYASKGRLPTIVFLLRLKDEARAKRVLSRVVTIAELGGGGGVKTNSFLVGGVQVDELDFTASRVRVFAAVFRDELVVVNDEQMIRKLIGGGGAKLADDPRFQRIQARAKMPQRTLGFTYTDLRAGIPAAFALSRRSGSAVPRAAVANTKPLDAELVYATREGDRYALTGFVAIK